MMRGSNIRNKKKNQQILTQNQKDTIAFQNTTKVLRERQKMHKGSWIPTSIHDENSIFSSTIPTKKPMKKQADLKHISINIFEIQSNFKPCCKKTNLSARNSSLFSEHQEQKEWKSTCKKVNQIPVSKQEIKKSCVRGSDSPLKKSSIDLSWEDTPVKKLSRYSAKKSMPTGEGTCLFQNKRRTTTTNNVSSIVFG